MEHELLKSQRNQVFEIIQKVGLNPADFKWVKVPSDVSSAHMLGGGMGGMIGSSGSRAMFPKLTLRNKQRYYYIFGFTGDRHSFICCPGNESFLEKRSGIGWKEQVSAVHNWAIRLKQEIESPDLWADMLKYQSQLSIMLPETSKNETISYAEYEIIEDRIYKFFEEVKKQYSLMEEEIKLLNHKQDILLESAKSQKSQGWMYTAIGVFATIVMSIPSIQNNMDIFSRLVKEFFGQIIHLLGQ